MELFVDPIRHIVVFHTRKGEIKHAQKECIPVRIHLEGKNMRGRLFIRKKEVIEKEYRKCKKKRYHLRQKAGKMIVWKEDFIALFYTWKTFIQQKRVTETN